ncbi:FHIP family protein CG3558 isoform X2 [Lucilia cuprina]|uniref:FHIP family protein CG3558 isoform X2 n=1 Tax=Lucilia cuprina TaxID=7375 RepID=UPI001F05D049|nr:FHIP family protein CG3558 isoform X2 [Lucilia cuprina]
MSWLRSSPLRQSLTRTHSNGSGAGSSFFTTSSSSGSTQHPVLRQRPIDTATDCDPRACYDSFCKHWQQAYEIIQRADGPNRTPSHDDVLAVVSHLDFMVTLLLVELHHCNKVALPDSSNVPPAPCLEYMLSENLLDKLYEWGCVTGRYANAVRLEQLKLYELLVSHSRHQLLCHEPFLRPLLKILASSQGEIFPPDLEKRLVILLNQLCVVLMQNVHLLDLFFFTSAQETQSPSNFIIFSLLIPYVHREGSLGHQARDALLLCMALSQKNSNIGTYIAQYSSMCPLLVTGLGGLYSRLPNSIEINSIDWHRITPDDVTEIPELTLFMNALEFCNAVVQVAHEMIKNQLLDFMYQGFIVPVLGPALLQTNVDSQISAMSYLDLILRSVTEPELMKLFVKFLLDMEKFDGERILDTLVERLSSQDPNLCMVTMALFDTLLGLHCEDLMLELLLKYLLPGKHVPISYRHKINKIDPYTNAAEFFLDLTPEVMKRARELTKHKHVGDTAHHTHPTMPSPTSTLSKTIGANWNYYGLHTGDSLYANYHAYLFEAHFRIVQCLTACSTWSHDYKYQKWPRKSSKGNNQTMEMVKQFFNEFNSSPLLEQSNLISSSTTFYEDKKQFDSLQSIGESSGYESFKWRPADEETAADELAPSTNVSVSMADIDLDSSSSSHKQNSILSKKEPWRMSKNRHEIHLTDLDFSEDLFAQGTVSLGPFLNAVCSKLQTFTSNTLYVNLHLTGLITRLAWYPLPLIHSILLRPDIVVTSDTPSFHQVLRILKQQIDAELPVVEDSLEIIDVARSYLIDREFRLINARKATENSPLHVAKVMTTQQSTYAAISASSPVQVTPSSSYDPFKRNDTKRMSISKSITSMFSRKSNATSGLSQIYAFFTGGSTSPFAVGSNTTASTSSTSPSLNNQNQATSSVNSSITRETSLTNLPPLGAKSSASTSSSSSSVTAATNERTNERSGSVSSTTTLQSNNSATATATTSYNNFPQHNSITSSLGDRASSTSTLTASSNLGNMAYMVGSGNGSEPASLDSISSTMGAITSGGTERTRDLALCAVLLDEWLKELAAIAQEQSVVMLDKDY